MITTKSWEISVKLEHGSTCLYSTQEVEAVGSIQALTSLGIQEQSELQETVSIHNCSYEDRLTGLSLFMYMCTHTQNDFFTHTCDISWWSCSSLCSASINDKSQNFVF